MRYLGEYASEEVYESAPYVYIDGEYVEWDDSMQHGAAMPHPVKMQHSVEIMLESSEDSAIL